MDQQQWRDLNDRYVTAAVAWVRALLVEQVPLVRSTAPQPAARQRGFFCWLLGDRDHESRNCGVVAPQSGRPEQTEASAEAACRLKTIQLELESAGAESATAQLAHRFGLSAFEQNILLLCLAFELDSQVGWLCGLIQDKPHRPFPTFGLAMSLYQEPEWVAIPPERPLRKFRLVEFRPLSGTPLFGAELRLEETVLHYLRGVPSLDARLMSFVSHATPRSGPLSPSQRMALDRLLPELSDSTPVPAVIQLSGADFVEAGRFASTIAGSLHRALFRTSLESLPTSLPDLDEFAQLWQRDSELFGLALVLDSQETGGPVDGLRVTRLLRLLSHVNTPLFVMTRERLALSGVHDLCFDVVAPSVDEQFHVWKRLLPEDLEHQTGLAGELSRHFLLDALVAQSAAAAALRAREERTSAEFVTQLRRECRERTRPRLEGLAQRIDVKATWADLVLSADHEELLHQICGQVQSRWRVYDEWGLADRMNRGLGISALFAGESGTGKTMAAEVLANDLQIDLYRVDLSMVVNKYIGETEKQLRRLFDAFEACGAILFFDECDALFGKRSEVKDSHDRYANIEINYLLQRLESYRGLAILATNNRSALDTAFLRRLRFVVPFEMPTTEERVRIWQRLLPPACEKARGPRIPVLALDYERLARFQLSGGSIQNIVLNAAFRAASRGEGHAVTMRDVLAATRDEFQKLERPINESDFRVREPASQVDVA